MLPGGGGGLFYRLLADYSTKLGANLYEELGAN